MRTRLIPKTRGSRVEITTTDSGKKFGSITVVVLGDDAQVEVVKDNGEKFSYDVPARPFRFPVTTAARAALEASAAPAPA